MEKPEFIYSKIRIQKFLYYNKCRLCDIALCKNDDKIKHEILLCHSCIIMLNIQKGLLPKSLYDNVF
jgi:hypothetical protein